MATGANQADTGGGVDPGLMKHGHVSYLEIPALDADRSATFYQKVFGWSVHPHATKPPSFDDNSGGLIGRWVTCRRPPESGLVPYIYVDGIDDVVSRITMHGGQIVKPVYPEGNLWVATFRDPAGNLFGVWQAGSRS